MATINAFEHSLLDVMARLDPDGKLADIAEVLTRENDVLRDMSWKEGNLPTGERTIVRATKPTVQFRALNQGIPRSKSTVAAVDDGAAMLEAISAIDRKMAVMTGNIAAYRLSEAKSFLEAMNDKMAETVFYGDARLDPTSFTGLTPRYNSLAGDTADQIVNAGGTGSQLRSIWIVVWAPDKITGIYPKNTKGGLFHTDVTNANGNAADGMPAGAIVTDESGREFLGYRDHYEWNCGLSVKDKRYAVRICNIAQDVLTKNKSAGADLEDLLIQGVERVQSLNGGRAAIYCTRRMRTWFRQQMLNGKSPYLTQEQYGGKMVEMFDGIPITRTDALNFNETAVA